MKDFVLDDSFKIIVFQTVRTHLIFFLVWYVFAVQLFSVVEEGTGVCKLSEYNNKR